MFTGYAESIYATFNRKDKSSFWNLLHISPVRDATGKVILTSYFLVQLSASNVYDLFSVRHQSILVVEVSAFMVLNEVSHISCAQIVFCWSGQMIYRYKSWETSRLLCENFFYFHFIKFALVLLVNKDKIDF